MCLKQESNRECCHRNQEGDQTIPVRTPCPKDVSRFTNTTWREVKRLSTTDHHCDRNQEKTRRRGPKAKSSHSHQ
ncbi:hypothetical protein QLX08_005921 [Tetragonisca angustula]|uniref:Uncharacterized protein n=1 Tax=Tetragonisca angustula TaxID=166442 RepID=A0AAW0ZWF7_9HYME